MVSATLDSAMGDTLTSDKKGEGIATHLAIAMKIKKPKKSVNSIYQSDQKKENLYALKGAQLSAISGVEK